MKIRSNKDTSKILWKPTPWELLSRKDQWAPSPSGLTAHPTLLSSKLHKVKIFYECLLLSFFKLKLWATGQVLATTSPSQRKCSKSLKGDQTAVFKRIETVPNPQDLGIQLQSWHAEENAPMETIRESSYVELLMDTKARTLQQKYLHRASDKPVMTDEFVC